MVIQQFTFSCLPADFLFLRDPVIFREGCEDDFVSISQRRDFAALKDDCDNTKRDELFREAVREQVEIEIYVPLRSTISKHLVYAWLNDDVEMKHKMKVCVLGCDSLFRASFGILNYISITYNFPSFQLKRLFPRNHNPSSESIQSTGAQANGSPSRPF